MTRPMHDPLVGATKLLVDGTNLLHALTRGPGEARQPPAAVVGRLRAAVPPDVQITLLFDGPPERGLRGERIAGGVTVRYSGRRTADEVLLQLVNDAATWSEPAGSGATTVLVITDDADLRAAIHRRGGRSSTTRWLIGRMDRPRLAAPSVGNPRPPKPPRLDQGPAGEDRDDRRWSPGRGATAKRGNPRRVSKAARRPGPPDRG